MPATVVMLITGYLEVEETISKTFFFLVFHLPLWFFHLSLPQNVSSCRPLHLILSLVTVLDNAQLL